jgi:hypothetical protein
LVALRGVVAVTSVIPSRMPLKGKYVTIGERAQCGIPATAAGRSTRLRTHVRGNGKVIASGRVNGTVTVSFKMHRVMNPASIRGILESPTGNEESTITKKCMSATEDIECRRLNLDKW